MYIASNGIKTAVILRDTDPVSPRNPDYQDNLGNMICWHSRYQLGDRHSYKSPNDFMEQITSNFVSDGDFFKAIHNGQFELLRTLEVEDGYEIQIKNIYSNSEKEWESDSYEPYSLTKTLELPDGTNSQSVREDLMSYCSASELMQLCNQSNQVAILPLYLYDHSGISISSGSFIGRAPHAEWDSGQIGFAYIDRETAMRELAIPLDTLRIAKVFDADHQSIRKIPRNDLSQSIDSILEDNGYCLVSAEDITNLYDSALIDVHSPNHAVIDPDSLNKGLIFKKGYNLYEFAGWNPDHSFNMKAVASFNPNFEKLTEVNWTERAVDYLNLEIQEYDNYLTGDVYGYQLYEGPDEIDSCWGFNPGSEDILDVMKGELHGWLPPDMEFELSYDSCFDIDDYFMNHDFPEHRKLIMQRVVTQLYEDFQTHVPFPYAKSFEDLRSNKDDVLTAIVESIYDTHLEPTSTLIRDTIFDHAGISRDCQPKISISDLDPNRDYTADELMGILKQKPSLSDLIAGAESRRTNQALIQPEHNPDFSGHSFE